MFYMLPTFTHIIQSSYMNPINLLSLILKNKKVGEVYVLTEVNNPQSISSKLLPQTRLSIDLLESLLIGNQQKLMHILITEKLNLEENLETFIMI